MVYHVQIIGLNQKKFYYIEYTCVYQKRSLLMSFFCYDVIILLYIEFVNNMALYFYDLQNVKKNNVLERRIHCVINQKIYLFEKHQLTLK